MLPFPKTTLLYMAATASVLLLTFLLIRGRPSVWKLEDKTTATLDSSLVILTDTTWLVDSIELLVNDEISYQLDSTLQLDTFWIEQGVSESDYK